jgi:hypothetical protein
MKTQNQQFEMTSIAEVMNKSFAALCKLTERKKTLAEVLEDNLTDEEFTKICKYITVSEAGKECKSIDEALCSFHWSATKEGRAYWAKVYARFEK